MKLVNKKYATLLAACLALTCGSVATQAEERNGQTVREGDFRQMEAGSKGPWQHPNQVSSQADEDAQANQDSASNASDDLSEVQSEYRTQQDQESRISESDGQMQNDRSMAEAAGDQEATVYFEFDSADLTEEAKQSLQSLKESISENDMQNMEVVIEGHTDSTGPSVYNEYLSEKRAKSVKEYLEQEDLAAKSWDIIPEGDSSPKADNDSRSGREENRRAVVRLQPSDSSARDDDGLSIR